MSDATRRRRHCRYVTKRQKSARATFRRGSRVVWVCLTKNDNSARRSKRLNITLQETNRTENKNYIEFNYSI